MKIVVTTTSAARTSEIDPRFGRALWFALLDAETGDVTFHDNRSGTKAAQGAGTQAAERVAALGADALVTGNIGPNAFEALRSAGVAVYLTYAGTVDSVVERLRAGRLSRAERPTRRGHS